MGSAKSRLHSGRTMRPLSTASLVSDGRAITWLAAIRRYIAFVIPANLAWEIAHVPLYTIWHKGTVGQIAFAVVHCTGGDVLIAATALLGSLVLLGNTRWPVERYAAVAAFALATGLGYTAFSEWLNTTVHQSWSYTESMPTLPALGVGLSPLAQWTVVPLAAFFPTRRAALSQVQKGKGEMNWTMERSAVQLAGAHGRCFESNSHPHGHRGPARVHQ